MGKGSIYLIVAPKMNAVKIGYTAGDPLKRLRQLQTGCPDDLQLADAGEGSPEQEALYHQTFSQWHLRGEWSEWNDQIYSAFIDVREWSNGIPTIPPLTEAGAIALMEVTQSCGGARKRYPDGSRHSEINWDEVALMIEGATNG